VNVLIRLPRFVTWPLGVIVAVTAVMLFHPGGLSAAFEEVRDSGMWKEKVKGCCDRDVELEGNRTLVVDRTTQKEYLVSQWIQGQLDFRTVARQFQELNRGAEHVFRAQRELYGAHLSEEELSALNAVLYLTSKLRTVPSAYQYHDRLRAEYTALFGHPPLQTR
jgi:hypothetical protein